jgi:hypothetical protein
VRNPAITFADGTVFPARTATTTLPFTVTPVRPILTSIVPPRTLVWNGTPFNQTVEANGDYFFAASRLMVVNDNNRELTPVNYERTRLFSTFPVTGIGTFLLKIKSAPGAEFESAFTDTLRVVNPAPVVNAPPALVAGSIPASITLSGQSFMTGVTATLAGLPATVTLNSPTSITLQFTPEIQSRMALNGAGTYHIVVNNPAPSLGAATTVLNVTNPPLSSISVAPTSYTLTSPVQTQFVTLTAGANSAFASNASVTFNGSPISQGFITRLSPTQLSVQVFYTTIPAAGTVSFVVTNPTVASGQNATASTQ